jgi:hypothetical protein
MFPPAPLGRSARGPRPGMASWVVSTSDLRSLATAARASASRHGRAIASGAAWSVAGAPTRAGACRADAVAGPEGRLLDIDRAFVITADSDAFELKQRSKKKLSESLVTNFLMKAGERFIPLSQQTRLMETLDEPGVDGTARGRIGVDFGSVSLCHVAAGMTESVIEFAKGFAVWDLAPGHYILHASGGTVLDLRGEPLPLDYGFDTFMEVAEAMDRRQRFVAAGSLELAREIVSALE